MMKKLTALLAVMVMVAVFVHPLVAGEKDQEQTFEGKLICAKCSLKEKGFEQCQNVLVVEKEGKASYYYLAKNEAYEKVGHVCLEEKRVRVTGSVEEKDGKMWLAAKEITQLKSEG